jgi:hypothetical protein
MVNVSYLVHVGCHLITTYRPCHRINGRGRNVWMKIGRRRRYGQIVEGGRKHVGRQLKGLHSTGREHVGRQIKGANLCSSTLQGANMSGANMLGVNMY